MPDLRNHIENQRQHNTQQDRRGQREVKNRVFAATDEVTRKSANWKIGAAGQNQYQSKGRKNQTEEQQRLSNIGHKSILKGKGLHQVKASTQKLSLET